MQQNVVDERCNVKELELFLKQDQNSYCSDAEHQYHFNVKKKLSSDQDQEVEYQGRLHEIQLLSLIV